MNTEDSKKKFKSVMFWQLALGNVEMLMNGMNPMPRKTVAPTQDIIEKYCNPMPGEEDVCEVKVDIALDKEDLDILKLGHLPEAQEDHWLMYTDDEWIRYFRSWTGMCGFEAHYSLKEDGFVIDLLKINKNLCEFGVNGEESGVELFRYLITAETGGDAGSAWMEYLKAWDMLDEKYNAQ